MAVYSKAFPIEEIIFEVFGWYVKSFINVKTGTILVTNQRIVFIEEKQIGGGGLLVAAAAAALGTTQPKLLVDLPFENLSHWEHPRKNDIKFLSQTGEGYTFRAVPYEEWNKKLEELTGKKGK